MSSPPDVHFQLTLLKHIDPNHWVFDRNYVRPKIKRGVNDNVYQIEDNDGFFSNLPEAKEVKRAKIPGITKKMKIERQ